MSHRSGLFSTTGIDRQIHDSDTLIGVHRSPAPAASFKITFSSYLCLHVPKYAITDGLSYMRCTRGLREKRIHAQVIVGHLVPATSRRAISPPICGMHLIFVAYHSVIYWSGFRVVSHNLPGLPRRVWNSLSSRNITMISS